MFFISATYFVSMLYLTTAVIKNNEPYSIQKLNNTGILFEEIGKLYVYHEKWSIFTEINITDIMDEIEIVKYMDTQLLKACENASNITFSCTTQKTVLQNLLNNINKRSETLAELTHRRRQRRSLFDGLGKGLHYLFGVLDHDDGEVIYSKIKSLEDDEKQLLELQKQQISIVKSTYQKIQKPVEDMQKKQVELTHAVSELQQLKHGLIRNQMLNEIVNTLTVLILEVEFKQQSLIDILVSIRNNQLHPLLIPPSQLIEIYHTIIPKDNRIKYEEEVILQALDIQSQILNGSLVVKISLPLFTRPPFTLQQIHLLPIDTNSNYSLILNSNYGYIASNLLTQEFMMFKKEDFTHHKKIITTFNEIIYVSPITTTINKGDVSKQCPLNFLFNPFNEPNHCEYVVRQKPLLLLSKLTKRNTWLYNSVEQIKTHITCTDGVYSMNLIGSGILTLNRPCHFTIQNQIIFYEGHETREIKINQPNITPPSKYLLTDQMEKALHTLSESKPKPLSVVKTSNINEILHQNTYSFEELEKQMQAYETRKREQSKQYHLPVASLSLSTIVFLFVLAGILIQTVNKCKSKIKISSPAHDNNTISQPNTTEPTYSEPKPRAKSKSNALPENPTPQIRSIQAIA